MSAALPFFSVVALGLFGARTQTHLPPKHLVTGSEKNPQNTQSLLRGLHKFS